MNSSTVKITEATLAIAVSAGIAIALGDTALYPIAFGMVIIALLYVLLENNAASKLNDITSFITGHLGGK